MNGVSCNLCGSARYEVRFQSEQHDVTVLDSCHYAATTDVYDGYGRVVECLRCRLLYTHPRLDATELLAAYRSVEDASYVVEIEGRRRAALRSLRAIERFKPSGRLLEVGCATGILLDVAQNRWQVEGVEPSHWAAEYARREFNVPVFAGTLEEARFPDSTFDVVVLADVIEHVADPKGLLREIRRILAPTGIAYVATPDVDSFFARVMKGAWWGLRPAHIFYFSRLTLQAALAEAGFRTLAISAYGKYFTLSYWVSRFKNYNPILCRTALQILAFCRLKDFLVYVNTHDSIEMIAQRVERRRNERN